MAHYIGGLLIAAMAVFVCGCSETAEIRTSPPNAKVFVDDEYIGISPTEFTVPRGQLSVPHTYRVELEGYQPEEGTIPKHVSAGRIVGGVFTVGILFIFKSPTYVGPADIRLKKVNADVAAVAASPEERLRRLKQLHAQGALTDDEYRKYTDEVVHGGP